MNLQQDNSLSSKNNLQISEDNLTTTEDTISLEEENIFAYKCKGKYYQKYEETINWNDPELDINWGIKQPILSKKDSNGKSFQEYRESNFGKK